MALSRNKTYQSDPEEESDIKAHKEVVKSRKRRSKQEKIIGLIRRTGTFQSERRDPADPAGMTSFESSRVSSHDEYETEARFLTEAPGDPTYLQLDHDYYSLALYAFYLNDVQRQVLNDLAKAKKK